MNVPGVAGPFDVRIFRREDAPLAADRDELVVPRA